jgi:ribosome-binding protein aMBF1 (putative translation factor)
MTPDQLRAIADPIERAQAARAVQAEKQAEHDAVVVVVREAVREARQTMSHAKIAAALGVTPSRVQQLEK